jgi:hypothetical protein
MRRNIVDVSLLSKFYESLDDLTFLRDFYVYVLSDHLVDAGIISVTLVHVFFSEESLQLVSNPG